MNVMLKSANLPNKQEMDEVYKEIHALRKRVSKLEAENRKTKVKKKMANEINIDPKLVEEILKFSRHVSDAPKLVSAPDEIVLETTEHDVAYEEDKVRLLSLQTIIRKTIPYTTCNCICTN